MATNRKLFLSVVSILIFQLITIVLCDVSQSGEENEVDSEPVIPVSLRPYLTDEVAAYEAPPDIKKKFVYYLSGFDEENRPIWVVEFGKWDIRGMVEGGHDKLHTYDRYFHQLVYRILNSTQIRSTPELPVSKVILLLDFDQYNLHQMHSIPTVTYTLNNFKKLLPTFKKMHAAYCINVNFVAETMINLVRPIMGSEFNKVFLYGTNKAKWIPRILQKIPRDSLPEWYGGVKHFKPYEVFG